MSYIFTFDASACTGCKACQAACKDKNNLPGGVLWRRVFEISGGEWQRAGDAWVNNVFAYNFSMACNHCIHPKCAGVCPTNAYRVRDDGIVILDSSKCIGCGYCNWACPYAVPQYDCAAGFMSKCNFCADRIDAGESPACVAACPMRVLGFSTDKSYSESGYEAPLWSLPGAEHPYPMPEYSRTQPHVLVKKHPAMANNIKKVVANREEVKTGKPKSELPLVIFTLLVQMAVGIIWVDLLLYLQPLALNMSGNYIPGSLLLVLAGGCLLVGTLVALLHLGTKRNAWRMISNLKKSSLSKESLLVGLFGMSLATLFIADIPALHWLTALFGVGLIYSMANVYYLRSMPAWNNSFTLFSFLLSAILLGQSLLGPFIFSSLIIVKLPSVLWIYFTVLPSSLLLCEAGVEIYLNRKKLEAIHWFRVALITMALICMLIAPVMLSTAGVLMYTIILLLVFTEEGIGRLLFYDQLRKRVL